jgi:hypothetical protein
MHARERWLQKAPSDACMRERDGCEGDGRPTLTSRLDPRKEVVKAADEIMASLEQHLDALYHILSFYPI